MKTQVLGSYPISGGSKFIVLVDGSYTRRSVENLIAQLQLQLSEGAFGDIEPIAVNPPFERIPQHASDPGFGPVPPEPDHCPHGIRKEFVSRCVPCNTPAKPGAEPK
jgi:hypothetical protein